MARRSLIGDMERKIKDAEAWQELLSASESIVCARSWKMEDKQMLRLSQAVNRITRVTNDD